MNTEPFKLPEQGNYAIEVYDGAFWLTIEKTLNFGEADERAKYYRKAQDKPVRVVSITKTPKERA